MMTVLLFPSPSQWIRKKTELFVFSRNVSDPIKNQNFSNWTEWIFTKKHYEKNISESLWKVLVTSLNRKSINCLWKARDFWHKQARHQKSLLCDSVESSQSEVACKLESFLKIWLVIFDIKKRAAKEDSAVWECRTIPILWCGRTIKSQTKNISISAV